MIRKSTREGWVVLPILLLLVACGREDPAPTNDQGVAEMGQYRYRDAHLSFSNALAIAPDNAVVKVNLAIATLNRQDPNDEQLTIDILAEVLAEDPENVRALYTTGIVNHYLGNAGETIQSLEKVAAVDPQDPYVAYFLGQAYLQNEQYELALQWLEKAIELDEYLRSAYWAGSTAARRLQRMAKVEELLAAYERYENNPLSHTAGIAYKEMGPKAEVVALQASVPAEAEKRLPEGPIFGEPQRVPIQGSVSSLTSVDLDSNDRWELVLHGAHTTVLTLHPDSTFHEFEGTSPSVTSDAALHWVDLNNDRSTDLATCGVDGLVTYTSGETGWADGVVISEEQCGSANIFDADHDGDLDLVALESGRILLYMNRLDGTFNRQEPVLSENFVASSFVPLDIDHDRDVDVLLIGTDGRLELLRNFRTWTYKSETAGSIGGSVTSAAIADISADGELDLVVGTDAGWEQLQYDRATGRFTSIRSGQDLTGVKDLVIQDFDGDGESEVVISHDSGVSMLDLRIGEVKETLDVEADAIELAYLSPNRGPGMYVIEGNELVLFPPGTGRHEFISLALAGQSSADQMRSNASGIGTKVRVRANQRWSVLDSLDQNTAPGQSLMPLSVGLNGSTQADFVELIWSDGVTQTEISLQNNTLQVLVETQRQLASCPIVFVWNGVAYEFVSDVLGVAALGFYYKDGETTPVRPFERLLVPGESLAPRGGYFEIKIGEPMEEILYLDHASLTMYDVPADWQMALDERLHVFSEEPTGKPIWYRETQIPTGAVSSSEGDALASILTQDFRAAEVGELHADYIGLLKDEFTLELEFDAPLPEQGAMLVAFGWLEYPYSQTVFAAEQQGLAYEPPSIDYMDASGEWQVIQENFGYPAGMPKQMSLPLGDLPLDTTRLRLRTNVEVYWDKLEIVRAEAREGVNGVNLPLADATVKRAGFAKRTTGSQRVPYYDYDERATHWDSKYAYGQYSRYGDATELVESLDSAVAIIGSGEEVHLRFKAPAPVAKGFNRFFVLDFRGWAKDMDMYTQLGEQVLPLPILDEHTTNRAEIDAKHAKYNTRFESGIASR